MLRARRLFLLSIVLFLTLVSVQPTPAIALGISGFNLARTDPGKADSSFHLNLKPGESITKEVLLKNTTTDTTQDLKIYVADALPTNNGGIALRGRFEPKKGVAKWIKINAPEEITLGPNEERLVTFDLNMPTESDSDERVCGLVVEGAVRRPQPNGQFSLKILPRVALLIYQRLPGPGIMRLEIVKFDRDWAGRNIKFNLTLKNVGNVSVQPKAAIDIYDMFGRKADSIPIQNMKTLFPKDVARSAPVWLDTPPIGYFTADVKIAYGKNKSERARIGFLIFPWWVLALLPPLWIIARRQRKLRAARELAKVEASRTEQKILANGGESEKTAASEPIAKPPTSVKKTPAKKPATRRKPAAKKPAAKKPAAKKPTAKKPAVKKPAAAKKPAAKKSAAKKSGEAPS